MHLYLHIPFCRRACHYCDFHFSTTLTLKSTLVEAMCKEIELQAEYLSNKRLETIYFGGGTPSLLNINELYDIFQTIYKHFTVAEDAEITLEANPDDITKEKLQIFQRFGINRLSIGIQTFDAANLKFLNRIHTSIQAEDSVKLSQDVGIDNITIDLIYAINPLETLPKKDRKNALGGHSIWHSDLGKAIELNVPHISAYCLTIEEKTVFGNWQKKNKISPIDDRFSAEQFEMLLNSLESVGYEQYEISNFARNEAYSRHNTSYWKRHEYLGVGPSAHSYNGFSRQFNISNNPKYIEAINQNRVPCQIEELTAEEKVNDYLMTGLRTKWGCEISEIEKLVEKRWEIENEKILAKYLDKQMLVLDNQVLTLTRKGKFFADRIASDLFLV